MAFLEASTDALVASVACSGVLHRVCIGNRWPQCHHLCSASRQLSMQAVSFSAFQDVCDWWLGEVRDWVDRSPVKIEMIIYWSLYRKVHKCKCKEFVTSSLSTSELELLAGLLTWLLAGLLAGLLGLRTSELELLAGLLTWLLAGLLAGLLTVLLAGFLDGLLTGL